jgi:hypothetical protein
MSKTAGSHIVLPTQLIMVKPEFFGFNTETSKSNVFQHAAMGALNVQDKHDCALKEFAGYHQMYIDNDIDVLVLDTTDGKKTDVTKIDYEQARPDEIFPNCVVTFPGSDLKRIGSIGRSGQSIDEKATYAIFMPMLEKNRQREKPAMVEFLKKNDYKVIEDVFEHDLSVYESQRRALEGTGALVLDRPNKVIYCALSDRADKELAQQFSDIVGYELVTFNTVKIAGKPIYHTDLITHIGGTYQNIASDFIAPEDKKRVLDVMQTYRKVYTLRPEQFMVFCGNSQPIMNRKGEEFLSLSTRAYDGFGPELREKIAINHGVRFIHADISTIETVGGGSGCCLALEGKHGKVFS